MNIQKLINDYLEKTKIYKKHGTYHYYCKVAKAITKALDYIRLENTSEFNKNTKTDIIIYYKNQTKKKNSQINADIGFLYQVMNYHEINHKLKKHEKIADDTTPFRALNDTVLNRLLAFLKTFDLNVSNISIYLSNAGYRC